MTPSVADGGGDERVMLWRIDGGDWYADSSLHPIPPESSVDDQIERVAFTARSEATALRKRVEEVEEELEVIYALLEATEARASSTEAEVARLREALEQAASESHHERQPAHMRRECVVCFALEPPPPTQESK